MQHQSHQSLNLRLLDPLSFDLDDTMTGFYIHLWLKNQQQGVRERIARLNNRSLRYPC